MKLLVSPLIGILVLLLLPNPTPLAFQLWEHGNLVFRIGLLISVVGIPAGLAEIFFARFDFSESGIEQRTKFLRKKFRPYSEIAAVEYRPETTFHPGFLTITFSDLHKIKIASGLANLQALLTILVEYGNKSIMTTSRELKH